MKNLFTSLLLVLFVSLLPINTIQAQNVSTGTGGSSDNESTQQHNAWLKQRFSEQHQKLIPVIAVADIFYACNMERKTEPTDYEFSDLILIMDKNLLAQKLALCLGDDTIQSEIAVNFGLIGCFHQQLSHLPLAEHQKNMALVQNSMLSLSSSERKKSFTQCATEQAINYLK
jgi:hypothetical protein